MPSGLASPARSASVHPFFRSRHATSPDTYSRTRTRGSARPNRPAIRSYTRSSSSATRFTIMRSMIPHGDQLSAVAVSSVKEQPSREKSVLLIGAEVLPGKITVRGGAYGLRHVAQKPTGAIHDAVRHGPAPGPGRSEPARDGDVGAGDVRRLRRDQPRHGVRDLVRPADSAQRALLYGEVPNVRSRSRHCRLDGPRRDAVGPDALGCDL